MNRRIRSVPVSNDEPFDNIIRLQSEHIFPDERPLTSTGRRRIRIINTHSDHNHNEIQIEDSVFNNQEDNDDEVAQGLPKEMLDKIRRMKMGKSGKDCSVCYNGFKNGEKIRKLPCKHIFHDSCIVPWFEKNITCPNCRFNLFEYFMENPEGDYK